MSSYTKAMKIYSQDLPKKKGKNDNNKKKLNLSVQQLKETVGGKGNNDLDYYYEIQRREHIAASRIQYIWKKSRRLIPWRLAVKRLLSVLKIQKIARGFLARKFVARWYHIRNRIIVELQARIRKYLSNIHLRPKQAIDQQSAVQIQRIIRGRLGRLKARKKLENQAVIRIQCLWRGCYERALADKKWLNKQVIIIQNAIRKKIAMNKFSFLFSRYRLSATKIQRKFRSFIALRKVGKLLHEREMKYRYDTIRLLSNEEEICLEKITRLMNRVIKQQVYENVQAAMQLIVKQEKEIYIKENDLIEFRRQREILSPRSIERGFYEELTNNIQSTHEEIAKLKFHHLFVLTSQLHQRERIFENQVHELEEHAALRHRVAKWRIDEYDERRHINYQRDINDRRKEKKQLIAEEKRRWQVLYYTKDGKPDKKRRPGKPWDKSVYAGPEKATYNSVAGVDLLAFLRPPDDPTKAKTTAGIVESVNNTVDQYSLQTFLDQVRVYEQLLNPINTILHKHMHLMPGQQQFIDSSGLDGNSSMSSSTNYKSNPPPLSPSKASKQYGAEKMGFGEVGKEFVDALRGLNVVDPPVEVNAIKKNRGLILKEEKQRRRKQKEEERMMILGDYQTLPLSPSSNHTSADVKAGFIPPITLEPGSTFSTQNTAREKSTDAPQPPPSSSIEGEAITAEALRQKLRRYWKKPYEPHLPKEETFADVDYGKYNHLYYYPMDDDDDDGSTSSRTAGGRRRKKKNKNKKGGKKKPKNLLPALPNAPPTNTLLSKSAPSFPLLNNNNNTTTNNGSVSNSQSNNNNSNNAMRDFYGALSPMSNTKLSPLASMTAGYVPIAKLGTTKFSELMSMDSSLTSPMPSIDSPALFNPIDHEKQKEENIRARKEQHEKRRERKKERQSMIMNHRGSLIPWELLDELDGAQRKFDNEKAFVEFYKKF